MTDRELLEAAAKAAGIDAEWQYQDNADFDAGHEGMRLKGARTPDNSKYWNPLTDDGDAMRLAVKLCVDVVYDPDGARVYKGAGFWREADEDRAAATRRAITRAAAAPAPLHPAAGGEAKA